MTQVWCLLTGSHKLTCHSNVHPIWIESHLQPVFSFVFRQFTQVWFNPNIDSIFFYTPTLKGWQAESTWNTGSPIYDGVGDLYVIHSAIKPWQSLWNDFYTQFSAKKQRTIDIFSVRPKYHFVLDLQTIYFIFYIFITAILAHFK